MSPRLVDLVDSNLYLFNLLFRHQVYLEGLKAGFATYFKRMLTDLYGEFSKYVGQSKYDNLDGFSRVELQQFIFRFQQAQTKSYNQYTQQLIGLLRDFLAADVQVGTAIYLAATKKETSQHNATAAEELEADSDDDSTVKQDALWASISQAIIPANGLTLTEMLNNFAASSRAKVTALISAGYANTATLRETFADITGNQDSNFRDGAFATFSNQNNAIIATALQHVSSLAQSSLSTPLYSQDQWIAILDSKTTIICRSRNGNVYPAGEGPFPPAHYFCRSKRIPLTQGDELHDIPDTFYDWTTTQPEEFLSDALGSVIAAKILNGDTVVKDISVSDSVIPLTLSQFLGKIDFITM